LTRVACHETTAVYQQHQQTGCRESRQSVDFSGWKQTDPIAADDPASKKTSSHERPTLDGHGPVLL
jgi:hypothetical protein